MFRARVEFALRAGYCMLALGYSTCFADKVIPGAQVLRFDSGPLNSVVSHGAIAVNRESRYEPSRGFGWLAPPRSAFVRDDLSRSRTPLTIDGVAGQELSFRVDVDAGQWNVTLWMEMDAFDPNFPQVSVQGENRIWKGQEFPESAEPSHHLPRLYRVFTTIAQVDASGLIVTIQGKDAKVRLLGISLMKVDNENSLACQTFFKRRLFGRDLCDFSSLHSLLQQTRSAANAAPQNGFLALCLQRLEFLAQAEKYYALRGWDWADEEMGLSMFDRHHQAVLLLDAYLAGANPEEVPFLDQARFLRGRLLYWLGKERGGDAVVANAQRDFNLLAEQYSTEKLLAMYRGERIESPDDCDRLPRTSAAPAWSILQREALCRMHAIVAWWTAKRQSSTGEFGGKFGDDVELLRWWAPLCLKGDQTALDGWKKLADGVWHSRHVSQGYARKLADVEHASEFIADTAPLMAVYHDSPEYLDRLRPSARHFGKTWTGITTKGNRFFRSAWFNATEVETAEPKGRDVELNCRAATALRFLAWREPDPGLVAHLHEWSLAWVEAALRTDKSKPPGIIPASVRFTDESFNGDGENWYDAQMHWHYFQWVHNCGSLLLDQLLFTYLLTEDDRLLQPMLLSLDLIQSTEAQAGQANLPLGSPAWAAENLRHCAHFWDVVEQWRFVSEDPTYDPLILRYGSPYGRYRVSGEEHHLLSALETLLEDLRVNVPLKTSEALYTDRVYLAEWKSLKAMLTGDGMHNNTSPYYSVSWEGTDEEFTALVTETSEAGLKLQLFSHASEARSPTMRVWRLDPGNYLLCCKTSDSPGVESRVHLQQNGQRIPLNLPAQQTMLIELSRVAESSEKHE